MKRKSGGCKCSGNSTVCKCSEQLTPESSDPQKQSQLVWPNWLPSDWLIHRVLHDPQQPMYYVDPVTQRRFWSKKEVLYYLETETPKRRKNADDADGLPVTDSTIPKGKKSEEKAKNPSENFNFDDVPAKVKWVLTDTYEGTWRPLTNGVDRVPESAKQEWAAAFTYLTLQNGGRGAFF